MADREVVEREYVRDVPSPSGDGMGAGVIVGILVGAIVLIIAAVLVFGGGNGDGEDNPIIPDTIDVNVDVNETDGGNGGDSED